MKKFSCISNNSNSAENSAINYLNHTKTYRSIDFDDVCYVANKICEHKIGFAINSEEMTASGIRESLERINATDIEIIQYKENDYEASLIMNYIPETRNMLDVPYKVQMTVCIGENENYTFSYGFSGFKIAKDGTTLWFDTAVLHSYYCNHPEKFDYTDFLNITETDEE